MPRPFQENSFVPAIQWWNAWCWKCVCLALLSKYITIREIHFSIQKNHRKQTGLEQQIETSLQEYSP